MDNHNIISQILHACRLARETEANLPNFANQHPSLLRIKCEDVARAFNMAIHELDKQEQWLQAKDLFGMRSMEEEANPIYVQRPPENEMSILPLMKTLGFGIESSSNASFGANAQDMDAHGTPFLGAGGQPEAAVAAGAVVAGSSSSGLVGRRPNSWSTGQRQSRKRRESKWTRSVRVPATRMGNMAVNPPDDGYTWRKYGQKDILGSRFPRSYFRCTHKNFYGCPATKKVQRLDEDPYTYEVTYCGDHTCQTSTAPLILPHLFTNNPQTEIVAGADATQAPFSSSISTSIQLSSHWFDLGHNDFHPLVGESSGAAHAGTSDCPVADLADVMFNSGSSDSSMDAIFSAKHDKPE